MVGTVTTTSTVGTGAANVNLPTINDTYISIKSHKANTGVIWVAEASGVTAAVDGDDCLPIEAGESVLMRRLDTISAIATVAAQKITISNARGRVR